MIRHLPQLFEKGLRQLKINIICFTDKGEMIANQIAYKLRDRDAEEIDRQSVSDIDVYRCEPGKLDAWTKKSFAEAEALIYIGACGIAVRAIAPYIKSKLEDPAVIVIDELGINIIPILSGHIGGANKLARKIEKVLGDSARVVITTATDIEKKFSIDEWAKKKGLLISDKNGIKHVSGKILRGEKISDRDVSISIYTDTDTVLRLVPKVVVLGIGCRKDTDIANIRSLVDKVLSDYKIDKASISQIASIDIKASEPGLVGIAEEIGTPFVTFVADELMQVEGNFNESEFVRDVTGVGNVCERSAVLSCSRLGENYKLLVNKTAMEGVTVAVAALDYSDLVSELSSILDNDFDS